MAKINGHDVLFNVIALNEPTGEIEITENGQFNVSAYATANVNVASGGTADGSLAHPFIISANLNAQCGVTE